MRDHLVLYINGVRHTVRGRDAFLSLSDYLRLRKGLIGTKIVCSEGDCGACTVLVGRPTMRIADCGFRNEGDGQDGNSSSFRNPQSAFRIRYLPIDSCIQFLFQLDCAHVVTVEGLRPDGELSPIQRAMVDCHGSQCGFCTPGCVMAMTGLRETHAQLDFDNLRLGLTGNLCRCTGYCSIVASGVLANEAPYEGLNELYPPVGMLEDFVSLRADAAILQAERFGEHHTVACPTTLAGALDFLAANPAATIVAGATDIGVRVNKSGRLPAVILDLNRVDELDRLEVVDGAVVAGTRASWTSVLELCESAVPEFARVLSTFGAPQIRHVGTIGGNIANASPIADSLPFLFVMEATLVLARSASAGRSTREVNINEFYLGYKKLDLRPGELIKEVRIPLPSDDDVLRLYKVTRRRDLDISSFTAAIRMQLDENDVIRGASIALGAVGPTVLRARMAEQFLQGKRLSEETMQQAGEIAVGETTPITDVRGAADYRRQLTRNVFLKFYHQSVADVVTT